MITSTELTEWTLRVDPAGPTSVPREAAALIGRDIPAVVPGAVHADLLRAGLIEDPLVSDNEEAAAWVSHTDWRYECTIDSCADAEHTDLVFAGLDTVARISLDGAEIGRSRNMHRSYRYDVTEALRGGPRRLAVHLSSAYTEAEALRRRIGPRPNAYPEPFNFVRKMACSFGWDWGPTVVGAGIWRPARLESWSVARIARLRPLTDAHAGTGSLRVLLDVQRAPSGASAALRATVLLDGAPVAFADLPAGRDSCEITAVVPDVRPWQPAGHGDPCRYDLQVALTGPDGDAVDRAERRIGFRRVGLDRGADEGGTRFLLLINDEPVLVKGVNWIPGDVLPGRMTRHRYETLLRQARDAGVNLVRVWGGGLYESEDFYEIADGLGLLVWQDFPFACAAYPEDEPLRGEVIAEATENVARLAGHPSLALWNGNNENLWLRGVERWAEQPGGDLPWGERYYFHDLPEIVARVDPSRPYTAGSPWSGTWDHDPNDPDHQTHHSWDVWNRLDYAHYRDLQPRFVAEFGWQAPATWRTLREAMPGEPIGPTSPGMQHRQKAIGGMDNLRRGLAPHAPVPHDPDAWHYLMQWNQARAIETGIRHWRSHWPHTAGSILWQLNDIWPALSWSAVDSAGRPKPLYHALRELYADRALTIEPAPAGLELCVLNDSAETWSGEVALRRVGDDGAVVASATLPVEVAARSVARAPIPGALAHFGHPRSEVLVADLLGARACWYAREPAETAFRGTAPHIDTTATAGSVHLRITATTVLRDLLVQADRIHPDAVADRGFLSLLPGESATVTVRCPEPISPADLDVPYAVAWLDGVIGGRR